MPFTFTCHHCGQTATGNHRLKKKQKYCSAKACQQARIRTWKNRKYKQSKRFKTKSLSAQASWRKKRPAHEYQREYRSSHPDYEERNRIQQSKRNEKRKKEPRSLVVKTNALVLQPRDDGAYILSKVKKELIVNRNALTLQPSIDGFYALFKVNEAKIVNRNAYPLEGSRTMGQGGIIGEKRI
jgi:hypothetical protein